MSENDFVLTNTACFSVNNADFKRFFISTVQVRFFFVKTVEINLIQNRGYICLKLLGLQHVALMM